jgi:methylthioribose-1-phosphate isomerase
MAPLTSIRISNGKLEIVNQLLLPHTVEFLEINTVAAAHDAIKTMKVFVHVFHLISVALMADGRFEEHQL